MNNTRFGLLLLIILTGLLLFWRLPNWFSQGNEKVIEAWGDGYKAYHAIFYHAQYDSSYSHFDGMNYPYGEHVIPGASQPIYANSMKWLKNFGLQPLDYSFGWIHASMLLSFILAASVLFILLRRLSLPVWISLLIAISLCFLSPQLERFTAHYGLAHIAVLPICLYLLLRYEQNPKWTWALGIAGVLIFYSAIHFYFFAILALSVGVYFIVRWLINKDWKLTLRYFAHGCIALLFPLVLFSVWLAFTDPIEDRSVAPWGFFHFYAYPEGIFTSMNQALWQWVDQSIINIRSVGFEGRSYVGLVASAYFFFALFRWIKNRFKKPFVIAAKDHSAFLNNSLLMAVLLLIFSFGLPFVLPGLQGLVEFTGPIRQFRSIGRFAWVFFYVVNICAIYELYQFTRSKKVNSRVILLIALAIILMESYNHQKQVNLGLDPIEEFQEGNKFTDLHIDFSKYQAILPVPYFNLGSDNFWWEGSGFSQQKTFTLSLQTGLPTTGAMLTRSSRQQGLNQFQLVTEPYRQPLALDDYPNDKPLLMVWDSVRVHEEEFAGRFEHLLNHAILIHAKGDLRLYELPLSSFRQNVEAQRNTILSQIDSFPLQRDNYQYQDSSAQWFHLSYDDQSSPKIYKGKGAKAVPANGSVPLFESDLPGIPKGPIRISMWMYANQDRHTRAKLYLEELDDETKTFVIDEVDAHHLVKVFDSNGWVLLEWDLERKFTNSQLKLRIQYGRLRTELIHFDELLIQPRDQELYYIHDDWVAWNNRFFQKR